MSDDYEEDRIELGMNASGERIIEGMRAEGRGMTAAGQTSEHAMLLIPASPPPPPTDAATSARPKGTEK